MSNENSRENMDNERTENSSSPGVDNPCLSEKTACLGTNEKANRPDTKEAENTGIAIKHGENESLNNLLAYDSDSGSSCEMMKLNLDWKVRGDLEEEESSSSSSSSEEESGVESDGEAPQNRGAIRRHQPPPKPTGESLDDLPPVPDLSTLNINVENEDFVHMGNVLGIVDKLVTVAAFPNSPAYNLDTLLFLENGKKPLGFVFDVLGQVTSPIYAIRFNSVEDIKNLHVEVGTKVYSAPKSKHTQYVFVQQLLKQKGSDASWEGDAECPPEFADYSDDENECVQRFGNRKVVPHVKRTHSGDNYKKFETTMNKRNLLNTKFNKYMDSFRQARFNKAKARHPQAAPQISAPAFDPAVPPPNVRFYVQPEYLGAYNNNQGYQPQNYFMNNFVANLAASSYHTGNNHPGPSHQ